MSVDQPAERQSRGSEVGGGAKRSYLLLSNIEEPDPYFILGYGPTLVF